MRLRRVAHSSPSQCARGADDSPARALCVRQGAPGPITAAIVGIPLHRGRACYTGRRHLVVIGCRVSSVFVFRRCRASAQTSHWHRPSIAFARAADRIAAAVAAAAAISVGPGIRIVRLSVGSAADCIPRDRGCGSSNVDAAGRMLWPALLYVVEFFIVVGFFVLLSCSLPLSFFLAFSFS